MRTKTTVLYRSCYHFGQRKQSLFRKLSLWMGFTVKYQRTKYEHFQQSFFIQLERMTDDFRKIQQTFVSKGPLPHIATSPSALAALRANSARRKVASLTRRHIGSALPFCQESFKMHHSHTLADQSGIKPKFCILPNEKISLNHQTFTRYQKIPTSHNNTTKMPSII